MNSFHFCCIFLFFTNRVCVFACEEKALVCYCFIVVVVRPVPSPATFTNLKNDGLLKMCLLQMKSWFWFEKEGFLFFFFFSFPSARFAFDVRARMNRSVALPFSNTRDAEHAFHASEGKVSLSFFFFFKARGRFEGNVTKICTNWIEMFLCGCWCLGKGKTQLAAGLHTCKAFPLPSAHAHSHTHTLTLTHIYWISTHLGCDCVGLLNRICCENVKTVQIQGSGFRAVKSLSHPFSPFSVIIKFRLARFDRLVSQSVDQVRLRGINESISRKPEVISWSFDQLGNNPSCCFIQVKEHVLIFHGSSSEN